MTAAAQRPRDEQRARLELLQTLQPEARLYTLDEAALLLCTTRAAVLRMIAAGELLAVRNRHDPRGYWLISATALEICVQHMGGGVRHERALHRMRRKLECLSF